VTPTTLIKKNPQEAIPVVAVMQQESNGKREHDAYDEGPYAKRTFHHILALQKQLQHQSC